MSQSFYQMDLINWPMYRMSLVFWLSNFWLWRAHIYPYLLTHTKVWIGTCSFYWNVSSTSCQGEKLSNLTFHRFCDGKYTQKKKNFLPEIHQNPALAPNSMPPFWPYFFSRVNYMSHASWKLQSSLLDNTSKLDS